REDQNTSFIEGRAIHTFDELTAILDYVPAGWENEEGEERASKGDEEIDEDDLPELDEDDEKTLEGDESLKWDDDEGEDDEGE
ncbi:hypothetical protein, partial [Escherichia coli]|uniref:hypothetical protein n=1 Tax=Escherichia coli TaxID=562 RepID=UPI00215A8256